MKLIKGYDTSKYSFYHPKDIDRQEKQNKFYEGI